jgi:hypothetical protein
VQNINDTAYGSRLALAKSSLGRDDAELL